MGLTLMKSNNPSLPHINPLIPFTENQKKNSTTYPRR